MSKGFDPMGVNDSIQIKFDIQFWFGLEKANNKLCLKFFVKHES